MTSEGENETRPAPEAAMKDKAPEKSVATPAGRELLRLPGVAAIALYMFVLSGIVIVGVAHGYLRPVYLAFSAAFIAAALGLLFLFRWAWNLTLAAVVLLTALFLWRFTGQRDIPSLMQGLLNLVMFLYLIRPEVRVHLR